MKRHTFQSLLIKGTVAAGTLGLVFASNLLPANAGGHKHRPHKPAGGDVEVESNNNNNNNNNNGAYGGTATADQDQGQHQGQEQTANGGKVILGNGHGNFSPESDAEAAAKAKSQADANSASFSGAKVIDHSKDINKSDSTSTSGAKIVDKSETSAAAAAAQEAKLNAKTGKQETTSVTQVSADDKSTHEYKSEAFSRNDSNDVNLKQSDGTRLEIPMCINGKVVTTEAHIANGFKQRYGGLDLGFLGGIKGGTVDSGEVAKSQKAVLSQVIFRDSEAGMRRMSKFVGNPAGKILFREHTSRMLTSDIRADKLDLKKLDEVNAADAEADIVANQMAAMAKRGEDTDISDCRPPQPKVIIKQVEQTGGTGHVDLPNEPVKTPRF